ncbi:hypothetical protein A5780_31685 [Nocardia sp. 852002-20019_SCH5090214]|jgi:pimeloyl-ACP methyl ester carboxylesterase|uniref:Non-heme chloroperoxidase n=2 Tax=Nocardia TaxID=1817 RepID=A0A231GVH9_9NOCA|nr:MULTISPECIES: alpha/beta hydrolase [Nocardia]OBA41007.1 hypothetical protein A5789_16210 [Nocardia sp. 852002-51101_SCH5132738]OBB52966.1 hypothetical protein A5748_14975 [Nocardia sp. 852002-51244_SCH5132740]OBF68454.1 hypothetical protein A9X06_33810 [Mycobacterium sp. 852002-51759_SCH5129042]MDN2495326.1 alpha/beta hydrolase [Nocardia nova]OBA50084.1 hypothetical protein A5780_31685 [Nocardia sp. 852002-20019_SCH5090214]
MTSTSVTVARPHRYVLKRTVDPTLQIAEWGSATPRVTIVLAHGLALSLESWEDVAQLIVAADPTVRVLAYDHRGHGESQVGAPATLEILADDLADVIDRLVPTGPIVVGGHSMGGMTLMALAERHPELVAARIAGVAFVATGAGDILRHRSRNRFWAWLLSLALAAAPFLVIPTHPLFVTRQLTRGVLFGAGSSSHDRNRAIRQLARSDPRTVAALTRSILSHHRYAMLERFDCRSVVLVGSRDQLTPVHHARAIRHRLSDSFLAVYPRAGHYLPYERCGEVAAHLLGLTLPSVATERDAA